MRATLIAASAVFLVLSGSAAAQSNVEGRVGKLESEMRAVQRKVFPAGTSRDLQPQVEAEQVASPVTGAPATSALADLNARVASLEGQLASLTGQIEQAGYGTRQVQEQFDSYRRATDARLKALEAGGAPAAAVSGLADPDQTPAATIRPAPARPAPTPARTAVTDTTAATGITRSNTGDAAEDAYLYGYRLWTAKRYGEAQAALKKAAADHPKARRYSFAQNLLGRAFLDDGKPSLASMAFYDNYKKMPDGERAPESLYYLGQALQKLNKPGDACKVYDELADVYAAKLTTRMKADIAAGRRTAKCK